MCGDGAIFRHLSRCSRRRRRCLRRRRLRRGGLSSHVRSFAVFPFSSFLRLIFSIFSSLHLFPSFLVLILSSFHWAVCLLCLLYLRACQHTACPACLPACPACLPACSVYLPIVLSCSLTNISCSTTCCWPRPHAIAAAERTVPTIQSEGTESMMARTAEIMGGESSSDHPFSIKTHSTSCRFLCDMISCRFLSCRFIHRFKLCISRSSHLSLLLLCT